MSCRPTTGKTSSHGGPEGFGRRVWQAQALAGGVRFTYESADGEQGYPGALRAEVDYVLDGCALHIRYRAQADAPTLVNLTNHTYFNLNGAGSGSALGHEPADLRAELHARARRLPSPRARSRPWPARPWDFREMRPIGEADLGFEQLALGGGYDHNYMIDGEHGTLRRAALLRADRSGLVMEVLTTSPAMQFYAANGLGGGARGQGRRGLSKPRRRLPGDAVPARRRAPPELPPVRAGARGETWTAETIYRFQAAPWRQRAVPWSTVRFAGTYK